MINKKSIWFITLFSLILVLSVYYITMPSELLLNTTGNGDTSETTLEPTTDVTESTELVALRTESDEEMSKEMDELQSVLTNENSTIEEKNTAFEQMKSLNTKRGEEETLEAKIKNTYSIESYIKIKNNAIEVVAKSNSNDATLANNIIRLVQENYSTSKYITVKFTS